MNKCWDFQDFSPSSSPRFPFGGILAIDLIFLWVSAGLSFHIVSGYHQKPMGLMLVSLSSLIFETNDVYLLGFIMWHPHHSLLLWEILHKHNCCPYDSSLKIGHSKSLLKVISCQCNLGSKLAHAPLTFQNLLQVPAMPFLVPW